MTPHEVIKVNIESVTRLLKKYSSAGKTIVDTEILIDSIENLSELCFAKGRQDSKVDTLLSVKEMVGEKNSPQVISNLLAGTENDKYLAFKLIGGNEMLDNIQSLLDTEINKIKEL